MKSWFGSYYNTQGGEPLAATVLAFEKKITIGFEQEGLNTILTWDMGDIETVFDHSLQATRISYTKDRNSKLIIDGKEPLAYIQELQAAQNKPWHKRGKTKEKGRSLLLFSGIIGLLIIAYFLLVPWLSEKMASTVSIATEEQFGDAVYNALQSSMNEDREAGLLLNEFFREMKMPGDYNIRITVVNDNIVNAFALPGGHIVVYSALLSRLKTYPELAALLSHEYVHVNNKHATRSIFRQLGSRVFLSLLFGKFGSVTSIMVDQADNLKSLKYSRRLEKEADMDGLMLLKERGIDPEGFARLLQHLEKSTPGSELPELLTSHPDLASRVAYIREAAAGDSVKENIQLKTIFDKLNKTSEP